jgi:adenine nucleotide transporter 17
MLAKTRLQTEKIETADGQGKKRRGIMDVWRDAYRRDGVDGLYQGLDAQVMKGFVNQGLTIMVKQR